MKQVTSLEEAKQLLKQCKMLVLRDSSFGDSEYDWYLDNQFQSVCVATGYSGRDSSVTIIQQNPIKFTGEQARELYECYKTLKAESNNGE